MLETNKNTTCFWHRVCPGLYKMGDITVEQVWDNESKQNMWRVVVGGKAIISWACLKDAKLTAHVIDRKVNGLSVCCGWRVYEKVLAGRLDFAAV